MTIISDKYQASNLVIASIFSLVYMKLQKNGFNGQKMMLQFDHTMKMH